MRGRSRLESIVPVFILFATLFSLSTAYLHSGVVCQEGGQVLGFPYPIFIQCYGPPLPSGGLGVEPATFFAGGLITDLVFWYVVSLILWIIGLRILARFRGGGRSQDQVHGLALVPESGTGGDNRSIECQRDFLFPYVAVSESHSHRIGDLRKRT